MHPMYTKQLFYTLVINIYYSSIYYHHFVMCSQKYIYYFIHLVE